MLPLLLMELPEQPLPAARQHRPVKPEPPPPSRLQVKHQPLKPLPRSNFITFKVNGPPRWAFFFAAELIIYP